MSSRDFRDAARAVRAGEELDAGRLAAYLKETLGWETGDLTIEQFPGGHSNLTYRVKVNAKECVLRRPPFGSKVKSAHDMGREVRVLKALSPLYPWAPQPYVYCEDESVLGAKFYLMQRIQGVVLRKQMPEGLVIEPGAARRLCENFIDRLVEIHAIDAQKVGLGDWGKPEGFVKRQIDGWTQRYHGSVTDDIPDVLEVASWLDANQPPSLPGSIIHNDYKFDNLILDSDDLSKIIGILDWEMSTLGDPLMDLGTALCYWVDSEDSDAMQMSAFGPTALPGMMTRKELAQRYAEKSGRDLSRIVFYYVFGLFKTAVVVQQIYYRYAKGLTTDPRFANLIWGVRILAQQARLSLGRESL